jgi:hypothetical protein
MNELRKLLTIENCKNFSTTVGQPTLRDLDLDSWKLFYHNAIPMGFSTLNLNKI